MKIPLQSYFEELKQEVLFTAGINNITSADCYVLSLKIQDKTQKRISETTLKRVFGFAASYYNSSIYTCNTLAEYCGFENYNDFLSHKEKEGLKCPKSQSWAVILEQAHKISRFNMESNKLKSGISFNFTIYRSQLDQIIDQFESSSKTACILKAPAGGGKTVALTHWLDRRINKKSDSDEKDIFLFINTFSLISSSIFSFHGNHWLSFILGMDDIKLLDEFINTYQDSAPGKFYLVLDDINNYYIDAKQYESIFTQLIDMANYFSGLKWFKIILSTRPSIFLKYKYLIERNDLIQDQWMIHNTHLNNFSIDEIHQLSQNLLGNTYVKTNRWHDNFSFIELPLHFQIYYQLKGKENYLKKITSADNYMIAGTYLNQYILKGANHHEKRVLLDQLSRFAYYNEETLCTDRHKAQSISKQALSAYKELLHLGIIYSYVTENKFRAASEIRFHSSIFGSYFLALRILTKNKGLFNSKLIEHINRSHYPNIVKRELLNWLLVFAIESAHFEFLNFLCSADFFKLNEVKLILFVHHNLEHLQNDSSKNKYVISELSKKMPDLVFLDYVLLHFSMNPKYEKVLEAFLNYELSPKQNILVHSALGLIALIQMREDKMKLHLDKMKQIGEQFYSVFAINPYTQLEALYRFFKYGEISRTALQEITTFNFKSEIDLSFHHQHIHSLALLVSQTSKSKLKTFRFLRASQKNHALIKLKFSADYIDFIQLVKAREWLKYKKVEKAKALQFTNPITINHNVIIQVFYAIYKMELAAFKGQSIDSYAHQIILASKKSNLLLAETFVHLFFIINMKASNPLSSLIQEHKTAVNTIINDSGFNTRSFEEWVNEAIDQSFYCLSADIEEA